jgi:hypothetical protein
MAACGASAAADNAWVGSFFPYRQFGQLPATRIDVGGGTLEVAFAPGELDLSHEVILDWVARGVRAVAAYYGRLPDLHSRLLIVPIDGAGVRGGTTFGYRGPAIRLAVGSDSTQADIDADWKSVHEMVHLAQPDFSSEHTWLAEGLAVYIEPIARVQAGQLTAKKIWHEMARDMPQGLPRASDGGLEGTTSWGRTYWGGAIFCLLADVEMRKRSGNSLGLQDAMRGVIAAGGTHDNSWPIERFISVGDRAVGMSVLAELYAKMGTQAYTPDLAALWRDLGVIDTPDGAHFDDDAPLAPIRRAITAQRAAP